MPVPSTAKLQEVLDIQMEYLEMCGSKERDLSHEDLSSLDEHRRAGHVTSLLEAFQVQRLHLLIATLHLHRMEGQHGDLVHMLGMSIERFWG